MFSSAGDGLGVRPAKNSVRPSPYICVNEGGSSGVSLQTSIFVNRDDLNQGDSRSSGDSVGSKEAIKVKAVAAPQVPNREEVELHELNHLPFRSWCKHCVAGQGIDERHLSGSSQENKEIPTISLDYMYMCEKDVVERGMPCLLYTSPSPRH